MSAKDKQRGQVLLMVTFALFAMCGVLGLAVDLGWSFFVKKSAQAAADAGALAAVAAAKNLAGSTFSCSSTIRCVAQPTSCGSGTVAGNLNSACVYASLNGFPQGGKVNVTVQSGACAAPGCTPPTVNGNLPALYWVTVRVNQQVPQLFSAVLGNTTALVSARATAAVTNVVVRGQLILLNRHNTHPGSNADANSDPNLTSGTDGTDLFLGNGTLSVPAGIRIASTLSPFGGNPAAAGVAANGSITSPTYIQSGGTVVGNWNPSPVSKGDGPMFWDPLAGKGQPPIVNNQSLPDVPVPGGNLAPGTYAPGNYYATITCGQSQCASGAPIALSASGTYNFVNSNFGQYIFYGGMVSSGDANVTLSPGEYVFAGTTTAGGSVFKMSGSGSINEASSNGAGELFIFTNLTYPGLPVPNAVADYQNNLQNPPFQYGDVQLTGSGSGNISMHGLNGSNLPSSAQVLQGFAPVALWQDQGNSHVAYDTSGNVVINASQTVLNCAANENTINDPCANSNVSPGSTSARMTINQSADNIKGAIYQPRGGWVKLTGAGGTASYQLITGAIDLNLDTGASLTLGGLSSAVTSLQTVLIE